MSKIERVSRHLRDQSFPALVCNAKRRTVFLNDAFSGLCGYSSQEMMGRSPGALLQGEKTDPETVAQIRMQLQSNVPFGFSIANYRKSGDLYYAGVYVIPFLEGPHSERYDIGLCRQLESLEEKPLSKTAPAFSRAVAGILALLRPDR